MNEKNTTGPRVLPKMMIAFVIRRCTVALGHTPNAAEFALWANNQGDERHPYCLFGRPITEFEACIILKHQARLVSATSASAEESWVGEDVLDLPSNVVSLASARERLRKGNIVSPLKR